MSNLLYSGSTASTGSEANLFTADTTDKTYIFGIDLDPMVNGDILVVKIKTKMLTGSTERVAYEFYFADVDGGGAPNQYSIPVLAKYSYVVSIQRVGGSDHTYDWGVFTP